MIENLKKVKVNYNDTKTADVVLVSFLLNLTYFTLFSVFLLLTLNKQMFAVTILDQSSGNYDIAFFGFLWHIINTIYLNVVSSCILRNYILLTSVKSTLNSLNTHFFRTYAVKKYPYSEPS